MACPGSYLDSWRCSMRLNDHGCHFGMLVIGGVGGGACVSYLKIMFLKTNMFAVIFSAIKNYVLWHTDWYKPGQGIIPKPWCTNGPAFDGQKVEYINKFSPHL